MKPIKSSELKVGDWFSTTPIYNAVNKNNEIVKHTQVAKVIRMKDKEITIKSWELFGEKINERARIHKGEELFLLDNNEILNLKKRLILHNLK